MRRAEERREKRERRRYGLCGGLIEPDAILLCQLLSLLCAYNLTGGTTYDLIRPCDSNEGGGGQAYPLIVHVGLVAHEDLVDALRGMLLNALHPDLNVCVHQEARQPTISQPLSHKGAHRRKGMERTRRAQGERS
jgi:hypothetical protein